MGTRTHVLLASAAHIATYTSPDIYVGPYRGIRVSIDATASAATPSVVPTINAKDTAPAVPVYTPMLTGVAITGASHKELVIWPSIAPVANVAVADVLPEIIQIKMTAADADSLTYSISYCLLP